MDIKNYLKSQSFKGFLLGIFIAIIMLTIFQMGVFVGYKKASFSNKFGDNFERNFKNPRGDFFAKNMMMSDIPGGHGAVGKIISIDLPFLIVSGFENIEKTILIDDKTEIREFRENINNEDLKIGDFVVIIGFPNESGQIEAKLIRKTPPPKNLLDKKIK